MNKETPLRFLFVSYGGGHSHMIAEVVIQLQQFYKNISVTCIALTTGKKNLQDRGIDSYGFSDFSYLFPQEVLQYGEKLAEENCNPDSGVSREETIAYLGMSYWDLIQKYGVDGAKNKYNQLKRHAFMPTQIMSKIFDLVSPHILVTTNSPRAELAAVRVANQRNIPSISLIDLFGWQHFKPIEAKHIIIQTKKTMDDMILRGESTDRQIYHVFGNPAFDKAIKHRATNRANWLNKNFPSISLSKPIVTWMDTPAYWNRKGGLHSRSLKDIVSNLDKVYEGVSGNGLQLLIRSHPSQKVSLYKEWIKNNGCPSDVALAYHCDLYDVITSSDICFGLTSTTLLEALYLNCKVALLCRDDLEERALPIVSLGLAWKVEDSDDFSSDFQDMLIDKERWISLQRNRFKLLSTEPASPKIARLVYSEAEKNLACLNDK